MSADSFGARATLPVDDLSYDIYRLDAVDTAARLPYSLKVLLENLLRNEDGHLVTAEQISALAAWAPTERQRHRDPVHAGPGADAGFHRRSVCGRPGRDAGGDDRSGR